MQTKIKGFTLLEVLVSLFIFSLLALIMTKALHTVIIASASTEQQAAHIANTEMALLLFSEEFSKIYENKSISSLSGTLHEISFIHQSSLLNNNPQKPNLEHSHYGIEHETFIHTISAEGLSHSRKLMAGLTDLRFRYLDNNMKFHQQWPPETSGKGTHDLPLAVEIQLSFQKEGNLEQLYLVQKEEELDASH